MKKSPVFLLDLDNCLFRFDDQLELLKKLEGNITNWISVKFSCSFQKADKIKYSLYSMYDGAPECFLKANIINTTKELSNCIMFINDISGTNIIPDKTLINKLTSLDKELCLLTNSPFNYAEIILCSLGVRQFFTTIFDITSNDFIFKSNPLLYQKMRNKIKSGFNDVIIVDDNLNNLIIAKSMGIRRCVWTKYGSRGGTKGIEEIDSIMDLH